MFEIINSDVFDGLQRVPDKSIHCAVTSPPYYGLRSYEGVQPRQWADGTRSVLGDEDTVERYVAHLVETFRELKRVLHPQGTFWLNIADCYAGGGKHTEPKHIYDIPDSSKPVRPRQRKLSGKDLLMVPARVALALQDDGWILRQDIIWAKGLSFCRTYSGTVMPESTRDRPTWAHEHLYLFTLVEDYFYDQDGCREPFAQSTRKEAQETYTGQGRKNYAAAKAQNPSDVKRRVVESIKRKQDLAGNPTYTGFNARWNSNPFPGVGRNLRNVWVIAKQNFKGAHFATFPEKLIEPIVKLATSEKGCCPKCGAQVQRKTVREPVPQAVQEAFDRARIASAETSGRTDGHTRRRPNYRRRVIATEWERGCEHEFDIRTDAVPSRVLDPFCGSGRAGIVAVRLGRDFTGIDASTGYCRMATEHIRAADRRSASRDGSDAGHAEPGDRTAEAHDATAVADSR